MTRAWSGSIDSAASETHCHRRTLSLSLLAKASRELTVWKLNRLGRNTQHVLAVVDQLTSRGIGFRSLTEGLHTEGPMGTAMLTIMAAFAQLERDTMIERTRAGLAAAAPTGARAGARARSTTPPPLKPVSSGIRASPPPTSRKCWGSPAPPCTATFPMVCRSLRDFTRGLLRPSSSAPVRGVGVISTGTNDLARGSVVAAVSTRHY